MSGTYFDILPQEIVVTILCNFTYDKAVHSLIRLLNDDTDSSYTKRGRMYRKLCLMLLPGMSVYPEEMYVNELYIPWEGLYRSVIIYMNNKVKFDKFEFYLLLGISNTNVFLLMLYDYFKNPSSEMILFIDTLIEYDTNHGVYIDSYLIEYFNNILIDICRKKIIILKEKILTFKEYIKTGPRRILSTYKDYIDMERIRIMIKVEEDGDIRIIHEEKKLSKIESLKRGYYPK